MKKLLFQKFLKDNFKLFVIMSFSIGIIVWVIQAVNFLDFITEDGHGLRVYFSYTALNFPKIFHRILPFIFFISLFYQLNQYEQRNELMIFWTNGISKLKFINVVVIYSLFFLIFQIILGSYISPKGQNEARSYIRSSNTDFFPSLIKEGKFIDTVRDLTIFIESKDSSGNYNNIFLKEFLNANKSKKDNKSQTIYAKSGRLKNQGQNRYLELYNGKIIDKNNGKINNFSFNKINFDLTKYVTKTTTYPKVQELNINILIKCLLHHYFNDGTKFYYKYLLCEKKNLKPVTQEVFKRIYKPIYIPLLSLLTCLMILRSKEDLYFNRYKIGLFLIVMFFIIISEISLRYVSNQFFGFSFFIIFPIFSFLTIYVYLIKRFNSE